MLIAAACMVAVVAQAPAAQDPPPADAVPRTAEDADRVATGRAPTPSGWSLLEPALHAAGGAAAIDAIKTIDVESRGTRRHGDASVEVTTHLQIALPDRLHQQAQFAFGTLTTLVGEGGAFLVSKDGAMPLPDAEAKALVANLRRNPIALLQAARRDGQGSNWSGFSLAGKTYVNLVSLISAGQETILGVDPETGLVRLVWYDTPELNGRVEIVYSDFRPVGGVQYPFAASGRLNDAPIFETTVTRARVNAPLDPGLFRPPPSVKRTK